MEFRDDFLKETTRFCFLLGSALRNCDGDQFTQVYDGIIPAHYTPDQVGAIKAEAVRISELCEEEFSELVLGARSYSLAQPPIYDNPPLACLNQELEPDPDPDPEPPATPETVEAEPPSCIETFEPEPQPDNLPDLPIFVANSAAATAAGAKSFTPTFSSLSKTSRYSKPKPAESMAGVTGDSGRRPNNNSSDSDEEQPRRVGCIDYFSKTSSPVVKTELSLHSVASKREEFKVDVSALDMSSDAGSDEDDIDKDSDSQYGLADTEASKRLFHEKLTHTNESRNSYEMEEYKVTKTPYHCPDDEFEGGIESGISEHTRLLYDRQRTTNNIVRESNNLVYDEAEDVANSSEDDGELKSVVVDKPTRDFHSMHRNFVPVDPDPVGTLAKESELKRRIKSTSSTQPVQKSYQAKSEPMYKKGYPMSYNSTNKAVDTQIAFASLEQGSKTKTSSEGTNVTSLLTSRSQPPFGDPVDRRRVEDTACNLLDDVKFDRPANMPSGEPVTQNDTTSKTGKKKKKSKSNEGDGDCKDENGNPLEGPALLEAGGSGKFRTLVDQTGASTSSSSSTTGAINSDAPSTNKNKRKKKVKDQGTVIEPQNDPDYVGEKDIDEILQYIGANDAPGAQPKSKKSKTVKNGVPQSTVQAVILPQQQKTPSPVDVNSKKPQAGNVTKEPSTTSKKKKSTNNAGSTEQKTANGEEKPKTENHVAAPEKEKEKKKKNSASTNNKTKESPVPNKTPEMNNGVEESTPKAKVAKESDDKIVKDSSEKTVKESDDKKEVSDIKVVKESKSNKLPKEPTAEKKTSNKTKKDKPRTTSEPKPELRNSEEYPPELLQNYILTDLEKFEPPEEEEFKVVKKKEKKKNNIPAFNPPTMNGHSRAAAWSTAPKSHSIDMDSGRRPVGRVKRSATPPPPSSRPQPPPMTHTVKPATAKVAPSPQGSIPQPQGPSSAPKPIAAVAPGGSNRPGSAGASTRPPVTAPSSENGDLDLAAFPELTRQRRHSSSDASSNDPPAPVTPAPISYANIAAGTSARKDDDDDAASGISSTERSERNSERSSERRHSDGAITVEQTPNSSVVTDNRTCSSSGDISVVTVTNHVQNNQDARSQEAKPQTKPQPQQQTQQQKKAVKQQPPQQEIQQPQQQDEVRQVQQVQQQVQQQAPQQPPPPAPIATPAPAPVAPVPQQQIVTSELPMTVAPPAPPMVPHPVLTAPMPMMYPPPPPQLYPQPPPPMFTAQMPPPPMYMQPPPTMVFPQNQGAMYIPVVPAPGLMRAPPPPVAPLPPSNPEMNQARPTAGSPVEFVNLTAAEAASLNRSNELTFEWAAADMAREEVEEEAEDDAQESTHNPEATVQVAENAVDNSEGRTDNVEPVEVASSESTFCFNHTCKNMQCTGQCNNTSMPAQNPDQPIPAPEEEMQDGGMEAEEEDSQMVLYPPFDRHFPPRELDPNFKQPVQPELLHSLFNTYKQAMQKVNPADMYRKPTNK